MPLSRDLIDRLPHVEGILNYLAPMPEKPMNLAYDPPPGVPRSTGVPEPHRMTIYDARPVAAQLSLDSEPGEGTTVTLIFPPKPRAFRFRSYIDSAKTGGTTKLPRLHDLI